MEEFDRLLRLYDQIYLSYDRKFSAPSKLERSLMDYFKKSPSSASAETYNNLAKLTEMEIQKAFADLQMKRGTEEFRQAEAEAIYNQLQSLVNIPRNKSGEIAAAGAYFEFYQKMKAANAEERNELALQNPFLNEMYQTEQRLRNKAFGELLADTKLKAPKVFEAPVDAIHFASFNPESGEYKDSEGNTHKVEKEDPKFALLRDGQQILRGVAPKTGHTDQSDALDLVRSRAQIALFGKHLEDSLCNDPKAKVNVVSLADNALTEWKKQKGAELGKQNRSIKDYRSCIAQAITDQKQTERVAFQKLSGVQNAAIRASRKLADLEKMEKEFSRLEKIWTNTDAEFDRLDESLKKPENATELAAIESRKKMKNISEREEKRHEYEQLLRVIRPKLAVAKEEYLRFNGLWEKEQQAFENSGLQNQLNLEKTKAKCQEQSTQDKDQELGEFVIQYLNKTIGRPYSENNKFGSENVSLWMAQRNFILDFIALSEQGSDLATLVSKSASPHPPQEKEWLEASKKLCGSAPSLLKDNFNKELARKKEEESSKSRSLAQITKALKESDENKKSFLDQNL